MTAKNQHGYHEYVGVGEKPAVNATDTFMFDIFRYYRFEIDARRVDWVVERRIGPKHTLHTIVPAGFSSYVRILHPAWSAESLDRADENAWAELRAGWREAEDLVPVRWADVAAKTKCETHRLMQWSDIGPPTIREPGTAGFDPPLEGELTADMVEALFELLTEFSGENQEVLCGFWEGSTPFDTSHARVRFESFTGDQSYVVFNTTLAGVRYGWLAAIEYSRCNHGIGTDGLAPNAVWPTSREWYVAVDFNLRSTYVGGPARLIDSICEEVDLETYEVLPGDRVFGSQ